jgi:hypothetical protein
VRGHKPIPIELRIEKYTHKTDTCWLWTGSKLGGYANLGSCGITFRVHRYVWEKANGPIPSGLLVLHKCDNPACIRLEYLYLGTDQDNTNDKYSKGRANSSHLTRADVIAIKRLCQEGYTYREIAATGIACIATIHNVVTGATWSKTHVATSNREECKGEN